jgi:hypothetical protein
MRCAGCGNEIAAWANGICYVCGRISREERRYGRHIAGHDQAHHEPVKMTPALSPDNRSAGNALPPRILSHEPPPLPPDECPICGQAVPQELLEQHVNGHKRLLGVGLSPASIPRAGPVQVEASPKEPTSDSIVHRAAWSPRQQQLCRQGINGLLEAIYRRPRLLSEIMLDGGLDEIAVDSIRQRRLVPFLRSVVQAWELDFSRSLQGPRWYILARRFSLDGEPALTLADIGLELSLSGERVRQLEKSAVSRLRSRKRSERLEGLVVCAARRCLEEDHPDS